MQGLVDTVCLLRGTHPHVEVEGMDQVGVGIMDIRSKCEVRRRKLSTIRLHRPSLVMVARWKMSTIAPWDLMVKGASVLWTSALGLAARGLGLFTDEPLPYTSYVSLLSSTNIFTSIDVGLHSGSPLRNESNTWR